MLAYREERISNAIGFFVAEHHKKTKEYPYQTSIWKYLAFFEFRHLAKYGDMPLGLEYRAMEHGPVPIELYSDVAVLHSDSFRTVSEDGTRYQFISIGKPCMDYFSQDEIDEMNNLILFFAQKWVTTRIMSDASHNDIIPWRKTWREKPNAMIDPELQFSGIQTKPYDKLTPQEEHYLMWRSLSTIA